MLEYEYENPSDEEIDRVLNQRKIKNLISDMVADFLYYDRKEDEDLPVGKIEELISSDEITMHYICTTFNRELFKGICGRYPLNDNN